MDSYREFKNRSSILEFRNISLNHRLLSGFYVIFWISTFYYFLNALYQNKKQNGYFIGITLARNLAFNVQHFLFALLVAVGTAWLVPLCALMLIRSLLSPALIKWLSSGLEVFLCLVLPTCLFKDIIFQLSRIQRAILCMISMANFMKIHSYGTFYFTTPSNLKPLFHAPFDAILADYCLYYFAPTFTYFGEYPRSEKIRIKYVLEKATMFLGCLFLAYILIEHFLMPIYLDRFKTSFLDSLLQLVIPMYLVNILLFFGLFEGLCNVAAECTRFADREFYDDWWNSVNFEEFARKWNKIVHAFLYRHVYLRLKCEFQLSKSVASLLTFFFSALLHELLIGCLTGKMNFRFFALQMTQIPLILVSKQSGFKKYQVAGNIATLLLQRSLSFWDRRRGAEGSGRLLGSFFKVKIVPEVSSSATGAQRRNIKLLLENLKVVRIVPEVKISPKTKRFLVLASLTGLASFWFYRHYLRPKESRLRRKLFTLAAVSLILADYKWTLRGEVPGTESYQQKISAAHRRSAGVLLRLANANGGVYTKAGQFITSMNGIPIEYRKHLCALEDQAESRPFHEIKSMILSEFPGKSIEDLFLFIEEAPVAAASLAQVHRAVTRNGEPVAVKVQYPLTEKCFYSDLGNMSLSSRIVRMVFPQIELDWIVRRFTQEIKNELDFEREGRNAEEVGRLFKDKPTLKIPDIYWSLTTKRVLTMELIEGVKITDMAQLRALGINPKRVVRTLYEIFGEMIFCHGFFHADPHPGNIMVQRRKGPLNFRIVLLDHGLYRRLVPSFREDFCELWKSLLPFDRRRLYAVSKRMGVQAHYQYFPLLISRGYWRSLKLVSLRELASLEVFNLVENVSEDLMLIIKSFVHLHYIASDLGTNSIDAAWVLAKYAYKGDSIFSMHSQSRAATMFGYAKYYAGYILFKFYMIRRELGELLYSLVFRIKNIELI